MSGINFIGFGGESMDRLEEPTGQTQQKITSSVGLSTPSETHDKTTRSFAQSMLQHTSHDPFAGTSISRKNFAKPVEPPVAAKNIPAPQPAKKLAGAVLASTISTPISAALDRMSARQIVGMAQITTIDRAFTHAVAMNYLSSFIRNGIMLVGGDEIGSKLGSNLVAGAMTGVAGSIATTPVNACKQALNTGKAKDIAAFVEFVRKNGLGQLFATVPTKLAYELLYGAILYASVQQAKAVLDGGQHGDLSYTAKGLEGIMAGLIATIPALLITQPLHVTTTMQRHNAFEGKPFTAAAVAKEIYAKEGFLGFYQALSKSMFRMGVPAAVTFGAASLAEKMYEQSNIQMRFPSPGAMMIADPFADLILNQDQEARLMEMIEDYLNAGLKGFEFGADPFAMQPVDDQRITVID